MATKTTQFFNSYDDIDGYWSFEEELFDDDAGTAQASTTDFGGNIATLQLYSTSIETTNLVGITVEILRSTDIMQNNLIHDYYPKFIIYDADFLTVDETDPFSDEDDYWTGVSGDPETKIYGSPYNLSGLTLSNFAGNIFTFDLSITSEPASDVTAFIQYAKINLYYSNSPLPTYFRP